MRFCQGTYMPYVYVYIDSHKPLVQWVIRVYHLNGKFSLHEKLLLHHFVSTRGGQSSPLPFGCFKISRLRIISPTPQTALQLLHAPHSLILQSLESVNHIKIYLVSSRPRLPDMRKNLTTN